MSGAKDRIVFAMPLRRFFEILARLVAAHDIEVVFQRFESDGLEAGVHVVPRGADLETMHQEGKYGPIYLSVGGLPQHETDWDFIQRCLDDLINIEPGATAPGQIELSEAYLLAEPSRARQVFDALEREIAASSHRGIRGVRHFYPDHYWSEEVRPLALYRALGKEASRFWIAEE